MAFPRIQEASERSRTASEGTVDVNSTSIRYIDVRLYSPEIARSKIDQFFSGEEGRKGLKGVAIATPQPSGGLALSLASRGIFLLVGELSTSVESLLEQFKAHMRFIAEAGRIPVPASTLPPTPGGLPRGVDANTRPRTESPYAQRPAYFDEAAYREWMGLLSQPWQEEDAWKSET
jgi:hypothetical protein